VIRAVTICFLVLLLFLGNIGVPVYTHICKEEGSFISLFYQDNSHCEKKQQKLPLCCRKKQEKDCCHNESKIYKLQSEFSFSSVKIHFETPIIIEEKLTFCSLLNFQIKALETKQFSGTDPPPLIYGRRMLIKNQVFRI
jgi:hypothetical protein